MNTRQIKVAFVEDDPVEITTVERALQKSVDGYGFDLQSFDDPKSFQEALKGGLEIDVAILDVHFDDHNDVTGIDLAAEIRKKRPGSIILMRTNDSGAVKECVAAGADDFIYKRGNEGELAFRVTVTYKAKRESSTSGKESYVGDPVIGDTMVGVAKRVPNIIGSAIRSVHIHGESGTGKEVVSDLFASVVKRGTPFVKVNCAAIAGGTMESELFGHVKGAFTGAAGSRRGLVEAANGGWLYLDEIAELTPQAQGALLRVLENGEFSRVGETETRKVDVKILSATNEDIPQRVKEKTFRADLWQRLCETEITLVPLRERTKEIGDLARHFAKTAEGGPYEISVPALEILKEYSWAKGNARELRNCIRAMTEHSVDGLLSPMGIPQRIWDEIGEADSKTYATGNDVNGGTEEGLRNQSIVVRWEGDMPTMREMYDRATLEYVRFVHKTMGRQSLRKLVQISGMSRSTISPKLKSCVERGWASARELKDLFDIEV